MKRFRKILFGESVPDINDPAYRSRRVRLENAGRKFVRLFRLDKLVAFIQTCANRSPKVFLTVVFGLVLVLFARNVTFMIKYSRIRHQQTSVIEMQDSLLQQRISNRTNQ